MTKKLQVYKCQVCGNMIEVIHEGAGELVCLRDPTVPLQEIGGESQPAVQQTQISRTTSSQRSEPNVMFFGGSGGPPR